jgi:hypothetical protein
MNQAMPLAEAALTDARGGEGGMGAEPEESRNCLSCSALKRLDKGRTLMSIEGGLMSTLPPSSPEWTEH